MLVIVAGAAAIVWLAFSNRQPMWVPRERCKYNLKEIAKSCIAYATESSIHRGTDPHMLPSVGPTEANWHQADVGNPGALWLLYKLSYISPEQLLCLEAEQVEGVRQLNETDKSLHEGVLCYSYLSQVPFIDPATGARVAGTSITNNPSYLVLIADRNPRTKLAALGIDTAQNGKNSRNHGGDGQNFARIDGSAEWTQTPRVFSKVEEGGKKVHDDIYMPGRGDVADNSTTGTRTSTEDFYLIP